VPPLHPPPSPPAARHEGPGVGEGGGGGGLEGRGGDARRGIWPPLSVVFFVLSASLGLGPGASDFFHLI
jgi:hypothetical protein